MARPNAAAARAERRQAREAAAAQPRADGERRGRRGGRKGRNDRRREGGERAAAHRRAQCRFERARARPAAGARRARRRWPDPEPVAADLRQACDPAGACTARDQRGRADSEPAAADLRQARHPAGAHAPRRDQRGRPDPEPAAADLRQALRAEGAGAERRARGGGGGRQEGGGARRASPTRCRPRSATSAPMPSRARRPAAVAGRRGRGKAGAAGAAARRRPRSRWHAAAGAASRAACRVRMQSFAKSLIQERFFMAIERTLSIIKPDAVAKNVIGQIYARFEAAGLKIVAARMAHLSRAEAEAFYAVHKARPFFNDLVELHDLRPGDDPGARRRERHRAQPRTDGRHRPEEGREGHASAPTSPTASMPMRCTAPTPPRPRRWRSPSSSRHEHLQPLTAARDGLQRMGAVNLLDFDLDGLAAYCDGLGEKRFRAQQLFRWMHQKGEPDFSRMSDLARSLRDKLAGVADGALADAASASRPRPTAPSSGCSTSATATRSKPCSSPRTTAARCACRRRPAARWAAASAPPATRASAAT